jgi:amino acid transporter
MANSDPPAESVSESSSAAAPQGDAQPRFARASSGLVRELSIADVGAFGILATGALFGVIYLFPVPQGVSTGINVPVMLVLAFLFSLLVYYVYAQLGSAMPRAGGDYLYESRALSPSVGFVVPWACQLLFWLAFPSLGAFGVSTLGLVPIADTLGLDGVSTFLLTTDGIFLVAAIFVIIGFFLTFFGLSTYRKLQRWVLIPVLGVAVVTIYVLLIANLGTDFAAKFDAFHAADGITFDGVQQAAAKEGFEGAGFNLGNTLIWIAVMAGVLPYTMYAAQGLMGEVRQAGNARKLFGAFAVPGFIVAIVMMAIPYAMLNSIVGSRFMDDYAIAFGSGQIAPVYVPNFSVFLSMLTTSDIVIVLISLGFVVSSFGIGYAVFINASRVMMAMGLDGALPKFFADVSPRYHTPVKAITLWSAVALGVAALFAYRPSVQLTVLIGGVVTSALVVGVTCLAAAFFPTRAREIFKSATQAGNRMLGTPALVVAGALGAGITAALIYVALTFDELGLTTKDARVVIIGAFVTGIIFYVGWRLYKRSQGVDTSLAYRYVPPE